MFVTSDIYDLAQDKVFQSGEASETLVCGVAVYGSEWPGYQAGAKFLMESAKCCGLFEKMNLAGYGHPGRPRYNLLAPKSLERLAAGKLRGAKDAKSVVISGSDAAPTAERGEVRIGGLVARTGGWIQKPTGAVRALWGYFIFPLGKGGEAKAHELFRLAVDLMGAEYGYFFVRDYLCRPENYVSGSGSAVMNDMAVHTEEMAEIVCWHRLNLDEQLWAEKRPLLRDLYQVNLISERHINEAINGLDYLDQWIQAEPGRGHLDDAGAGRLTWTLTDAEMVSVRPTLNEAGLLFACIPRVYRDLSWAGAGPRSDRSSGDVGLAN